MIPSTNAVSLYERSGGQAAVQAAVDRFYERVLADPLLGQFFEGLSMPPLKSHQFAFLSQAIGGPKQYSGASMRAAHQRLAVEQRHFDAVASHLVQTLRELNLPENIIGEVAAAVTPLSSQIVASTESAVA